MLLNQDDLPIHLLVKLRLRHGMLLMLLLHHLLHAHLVGQLSWQGSVHNPSVRLLRAPLLAYELVSRYQDHSFVGVDEELRDLLLLLRRR